MTSKIRSPRYPIIGLRDAIEKAALVYRSDYRNKIPKEIVAQHIGYSGLNGKSLGIISALTKYGLLEGSRESMWATDRLVDIIEREKGDPDRVMAIKEASVAPEPFADIAKQFPEKASDQAIRAFLISKRQYLPDSATRLIRSYRETQEVVDEEVGGYDSPEKQEGQPQMQPAQHSHPVPATREAASPAASFGHETKRIAVEDDEREWIRGPLSRESSYRLIVSGRLGPKEIGKLIKLLQAQKAVLDDDDDDDEIEL
ncbi:hypothetical protein [Bosea sp. CS1GBMeth4]|uniref:hypothetical protein n=1 Tax=Bosea sp. CS1GBMeth4 TaxID=1892849 RepID=UPI00164907F1|nr:hypothetical protein [Bosea sp. CS1GBMeth4]